MNQKEFSESNLKSLIEIAVQKHQLGQLDEAELLYKQVLQVLAQSVSEQDSFRSQYLPIVISNLGNIFEQQGKLESAEEYYQQALKLKPDYAEAFYNLGNVLDKQGKLEAASASYQQALKLNPQLAEAHHNLGNVLKQQGKLEAAIASYQQALRLKPDYAQAHHNLGNIFFNQGKLEAALESYQQALRLKPNYAQSLHQSGNIYLQRGKPDTALKFYQQVLKIKPNHAEALHQSGNALKQLKKLEAAIKCYQQALEIEPDPNTYFNLGNIFFNQGKLEAAIECYQQALTINPDFPPAKLGIAINQLPIIYSSAAEINIRRNSYQQHLQELANNYKSANPQQLKKAVKSVGALQPFFLAYQGLNDRDLQQTYGEMMVQIMSSSYPQWSQPLTIPNLQVNEKIRLGFVSRFFCNHSNWKIPIKGWIENLDRSEFELFAYHTHFNRDRNTSTAAQEFDRFTQGPHSLEEWCQLIRQDNLHILIFPEFGMDPMTVKLGCLRLAPIQITSWGHPQTSGLSTIDYYLSSDLMEPENAQEHYTEKLVRLPNLSIYYQPLEIEIAAIGKQDIGIAEDEIMFWCCQSLFKYLPQHDDVFPRIAQDLDQCKFVFIQNESESITEVFRQRLSDIFQEFGLNYQDYCLFLSRMDSKTFASTAAIADVFLDSIGWSGCNSTLEAIAHNVPVVTLPGELMRGRHSLAILKMMGIEETIAATKEDYLQIAVRLGRDAEYRRQISQQVAENKYKLYRDLKPVRALEDFLLCRLGKESRVNQSQSDNGIALEVQFLLNEAFEECKLGKLYAAESLYKQVLQIQPDNINAQVSLAEIFQKQNRLDATIEAYQKVLTLAPNRLIASAAHNSLGNSFHTLGNLEAAVESYQQASEITPDLVDTYYNLANVLAKQLKLEAAIESYQKALEIAPDLVEAKFGICMAQLPIIYKNFAEINIRRNNYQQHLQDLSAYYKLAKIQELKNASDAVGSLQPFYLAYQGLNDRGLQKTYGEMLVQIMSNCYPQWSQNIPLPDLQANEKIRIGFVSRYFYEHSVWKIPMKGWVENLNRSEFELFGYHTDFQRDRETSRIAKVFDKFIQGPQTLKKWADIIQKDKLHILIFPEFGMDTATVRLGCLKLAPVQIAFGGHPETSGLPTIDYHLSSDLMEPENAQEHYTEKLVRLPNLAIHYTPLAIEPQPTSKNDIGIAEDEIMFWSCQSLYKYLPQHDDVFPRIARDLDKCKFVFIQHQNEDVTQVFRQRLSRAFDQFGLNYQDYCIFLPRLNSSKFAGITAIADVFLDNIGWSGNNTTMESTAFNVPIVTYPGELMRGRHAMAILKMMGIEETIASSKEDYVQLAIRLGRDAPYRQYLSQLIAQNKHKLYGDLEPIQALEEFLLQAVGRERTPAITNVAETLRLAIQEHRANRLDQAKQSYQQVLSIQPNHSEALYGLGMLTQQQGNFSEAEKFLSTAAQVQPDSVKVWFTLGNLRQLQGNFAAAQAAYKRALILRPDAASIYNNLGYTLQEQSKWEEAITCYQKALKVQHNCVEADVNLGNALHAQGKLSPEKQAHYAELNHKLGLSRIKAGDLETAEVYLQKALELNPNHALAYKSLGEIYESQHKLKEAEAVYLQSNKNI
ncbi:tetratricopeptide repeat protein [Pleurocapsa sp. PCC 7319]|uniref:tetratricopeptide repeat protein n=1 Tax=Pleurocapsa sp. PCC 7319 TaxID=118161 RepID=UPI000348553A|nr:tetratricopeptide repeat protein [Pleurocapsa sp. PCC 7319]